MTITYPTITDRLLIRGRAVIKESYRYYKVYLPMEYNDIWEKLYGESKRVDPLVMLKRTEWGAGLFR